MPRLQDTPSSHPKALAMLNSFLVFLEHVSEQARDITTSEGIGNCLCRWLVSGFLLSRDNYICWPFPSAGVYADQIFKVPNKFVDVYVIRIPVETVFYETCNKLNHLKCLPCIISCLVNHCFLSLVILPQDRKEHNVMKRTMVPDFRQAPFTWYIVPKDV